VSHNDQKDFLRLAMSAQGIGGVVVETANKLQGFEFDVVVAWHPLTGLPEPDGFHLDPGRLCILLTRHRHACIVVGRVPTDSSVPTAFETERSSGIQRHL
jgi:superfamily I DNA and/or RNA helicase